MKLFLVAPRLPKIALATLAASLGLLGLWLVSAWGVSAGVWAMGGAATPVGGTILALAWKILDRLSDVRKSTDSLPTNARDQVRKAIRKERHRVFVASLIATPVLLTVTTASGAILKSGALSSFAIGALTYFGFAAIGLLLPILVSNWYSFDSTEKMTQDIGDLSKTLEARDSALTAMAHERKSLDLLKTDPSLLGYHTTR